VTIDALEREIARYLTLKDFDALRLVLAAAASHELDGDPVWLIIVGPASSAKTEFINLLQEVPKVKHLSSLTPKTLASGFEKRGAETSFLARLEDSILTLKDLTTVLEMDRNERKAVLAQLREVYDGRYDQSWGTGKYFHWKGRVTLIAGVTPVIDRYHAVMASLGPRFLFVRPQGAGRESVARKALEAAVDPISRGALAERAAEFFAGLATIPIVPTEQFDVLAPLADFVSRARSDVERDSRTREIDAMPEPEYPARVAKQLHILARGLARIEQRAETNSDDMRRLVRVGLDTIPPLRRAVLEGLERPKTLAQVADGYGGCSESTIRRTAEDLQALGLVREVGERWERSELAGVMQLVGTGVAE
jgi:hypothetical protein